MAMKNLFGKEDSRILSLEEEIEERRNEALRKNRYCAFNFDIIKNLLEKCKKANDFENYRYFYGLASSCDKRCSLSEEDGNRINERMRDPKNIEAVHRAYIGDLGQNGFNTLMEMLQGRFVNNGHVMSSGAYEKTPGLTAVATPLVGLGGLLNLFSRYNDSNVIILFRFPKDLVDVELQFKGNGVEEIYQREFGHCFINPKYIEGVIIKEPDRDRYYSREQLLGKKQNQTY